jgi:hypothetical protein
MAIQEASTFNVAKDTLKQVFPATGAFTDVTSQQEIFFRGLEQFSIFAIQIEHNLDAPATVSLARLMLPTRIDNQPVKFDSDDFVDSSGTITLPAGKGSAIYDLQIRQLDTLALIYSPGSVTTAGQLFIKLTASR